MLSGRFCSVVFVAMLASRLIVQTAAFGMSSRIGVSRMHWAIRTPLLVHMSSSSSPSSSTSKPSAGQWSKNEDIAVQFLADSDTAMVQGERSSGDSNIRVPEEGSLRTKVRQHVNPLASKSQQPADLASDWLATSFKEPMLPAVIDIGCAKGTWCLKYATAYKGQVNVLGLEIRRPIVELALSRKERWQLDNVHFVASNANVDLVRILTDLQTQQVPIKMVTIQFPDPYFKKKQHKRRVVNEELVLALARALLPDTVLFVQSDVLDVQEWMVEVIGASAYFSAGEGYDARDLMANPPAYPIQTEREIATGNKNLPVYRMLFRRNSKAMN